MSEDSPADDSAAAARAAAFALGQGGPRAEAFLEEQTLLARVQRAQIEEENAVRRRLLKLEHASALFKLALELAAAAVVAVLLTALGAAMWNASHDNGLVVESFSVPSDLASRGLTGEVVAAKLLDKLAWLQQQTQSNRAASSYANNWGDDIKLQIPDTGVSIGEFNRTLHAWLGHQTRITGEVYRTGTGLAITARAGNVASPTFEGGDLDRLIRDAAERVYRATQPYRYAVFLANANRNDEAEALYSRLIATGTPQDRAWAMIGLENHYATRGENARALAILNEALQVRPDFLMAWFNIASIEGQLQHDEQVLRAHRKIAAILHRGADRDIAPGSSVLNLPSSEASVAADTGDLLAELRFSAEVQRQPDTDGQVEQARRNDAIAYALLHDPKGVRETFARLPASTDPATVFGRLSIRAFTDLLLGHPGMAIEKRADFEEALAGGGPVAEDRLTRQFRPAIALAFAMQRRFAEAHALIDPSPLDCILCLRVRGRIAALEKDWAAADRWFAQAERAAPSSPFVSSDWGRALLLKGDAAGAVEKFKRANAQGPRFADALEGWGEALVMQNRSDRALPKFAEAARYAPNWKRLHRKWGEALSYLGKTGEAAKQLAIARSLHE